MEKCEFVSQNADGTAKKPWHPPTMEEVAYGATAAAIVTTGADFGFYTGIATQGFSKPTP